MSVKVSFVNQKGGVGKTTVSREAAFYLSQLGKKVLLIDMDPQGNLSQGIVESETRGLFNALTGLEYDFTEVNAHLSIITGSPVLATLEKTLVAEMDAYKRLQNLFENDSRYDEFEYIFMDCPPSLGILTVNSLASCNRVIIPVAPRLYSLQGTNELLETLNKVKKNFNPSLLIAGVSINAYDPRPRICREIKEELSETFGDRLFKTALGHSSKVEDAISLREGMVNIKEFKHLTITKQIKDLTAELLTALEGDQT